MEQYQKQVKKKEARRAAERKLIKSMESKLNGPVDPKKPVEFSFSKDDPESFSHVAGIGNTLLEKKSDGNCVHVIVDRNASERTRIYSSQLNQWNPECFPEIMREMALQPSGYYHGEILGMKPKGAKAKGFRALDEYIAISNRPKLKAEKVTAELLREYPLKLDIFDILRLGSRPLLSVPFEGRREILETRIKQESSVGIIPQWDASSAKAMQERFLWAIGNGYEGLIAKDPSSLYLPGSVDNDWIKLKEFTTLDLVVLGIYETPESRKAGKPFSAVLVGTYNQSTKKYETIGKVKVGAISDQEKIRKALPKLVSTHASLEGIRKANPDICVNPAIESIERKMPGRVVVYPDPNRLAIVEIKILDVTYSENWHSCGMGKGEGKAHSLRIPTFKQLRTDKTRRQDITSTQQVQEFYAKGKSVQ